MHARGMLVYAQIYRVAAKERQAGRQAGRPRRTSGE
jgi:hypothetical protein